ncbi:hypothetical protein LCGC14_1067610 [marine sediment metagenome]|uniref:Uncharacterized protein n=1 Tax=marine sediment metagenome TaxID=412755 RepID=A0A0F9Q2C9_9ZZZZ
MKESPRSKLLRYLNFSDKSGGGDDILFNMYKMGLWETYFFYYPSPYIAMKNAIKRPNTMLIIGVFNCWKKYFGIT